MVRRLLLACVAGALVISGVAVALSLVPAPIADAEPVMTAPAPASAVTLQDGTSAVPSVVGAARDAVAALPEPEPKSTTSTGGTGGTGGEECIGFGCSDEQDALLAVQEAEAQDEYWATAEPEPTYQTSGDAQRDWGCKQGYITDGC